MTPFDFDAAERTMGAAEACAFFGALADGLSRTDADPALLAFNAMGAARIFLAEGEIVQW